MFGSRFSVQKIYKWDLLNLLFGCRVSENWDKYFSVKFIWGFVVEKKNLNNER